MDCGAPPVTCAGATASIAAASRRPGVPPRARGGLWPPRVISPNVESVCCSYMPEFDDMQSSKPTNFLKDRKFYTSHGCAPPRAGPPSRSTGSGQVSHKFRTGLGSRGPGLVRADGLVQNAEMLQPRGGAHHARHVPRPDIRIRAGRTAPTQATSTYILAHSKQRAFATHHSHIHAGTYAAAAGSAPMCRPINSESRDSRAVLGPRTRPDRTNRIVAI